MKLKPVSLQSALVFTCCTAAGLLLCSQFTVAQGQQPAANQAPQLEQQLPAALEKILQNWENQSAKIEKLEGKHIRREYDDVFQVEKKSEGRFYYEQPDKGRIDIAGMDIPAGAKSDKPNAKGDFYDLKPGQDERWICDGKRIFSIDEKEKKYEVYPIPLERRGVNIMEGPLPFLFGMPAKVAKQRYYLKLLVNTPEQIIIAAKPRRRADAANYREAKIKLDPKTYLPAAVQLIHPSGDQSTVYIFSDVVANKNRGILDGIFGKDPFTPKLVGYRLEGKVVADAGEKKVERPVQQPVQRPVQQVPVQQATFKVPNMVGHDFQSAEALLQKMGFQTKVWPGDPAGEPRLIHHVYQQVPMPGATAKKGQTVHLKLYIDPNKAKN